MKRSLYLILFLAGLFCTFLMGACSSPDETPKSRAFLYGQISVDTELDTTDNYSGIQLFIGLPDSLGELTDTVFYAETDREGYYEDTAEFERSNLYSINVSRYGEHITSHNLVLAAGDTVRFDGVLPNLQETAEVTSRENDLYEKYERLDRGMNRLIQFVNAGMVTGDTLEIEMKKWSNLFWDFYDDNSDSFAGERAAVSSIALLDGWDQELMMERLREIVRQDSKFIPFGSRIGSRYYAHNASLDSALSFLDTLETYDAEQDVRQQLQINRIELLYDSARVDEAKKLLEKFKLEHSDDREARLWMDRFEYDLTSLAPGSEIPDFQIRNLDGELITKESMAGTAYLLELTRLDNRLYQQQYDRGIAIFHIYKNYGVEFITVPFRGSTVMVNAFFDERPLLWDVASPGSFDEEEFREKFNINIIPTRILVDRDGIVIRKYEGTEFNDVINGLRQILNSNTEEPS